MRSREFTTILFEYDKDVTIRAYGPAILKRAEAEYGNPGTPELLYKYVFDRFEDGDPTFDLRTNRGGMYVPWIAREYARGGELARGHIRRLEDIRARVRPALEIYHKYKRRADFPAELRDIMRITWADLENAIDKYKPETVQVDRGQATTVYNDKDVRVVVPHDQTAACYYGQGTKWCTAATQGVNYFDRYNREGPLYILVPKSPEYTGEKYQLHFPSSQFMNEEDEPNDLIEIIEHRFPGLKKFFLERESDKLKDRIAFIDDAHLLRLYQLITKHANELAREMIIDKENDDDNFRDWQVDNAIARGYIDENDDIDWDRVHEDSDLDYTSYNENAGHFLGIFDDYARSSAIPSQSQVNLLRQAIRNLDVNTEMEEVAALPEIVRDLIADTLYDTIGHRHRRYYDITNIMRNFIILTDPDDWAQKRMENRGLRKREQVGPYVVYTT